MTFKVLAVVVEQFSHVYEFRTAKTWSAKVTFLLCFVTNSFR